MEDVMKNKNTGGKMENLDFKAEYNQVKDRLVEKGFPKGVVAFGSARIPYSDPHIQEIREIAGDCAKHVLENEKKTSFITGGGPSVMTAWLEMPHKLGAETGAMALKLPHETKDQQMKFCDPDTSHCFQTFQARKAIMFEFAKAIVVFKGGFGTMDELFEALTLIKTGKIPEIPLIIYPEDFYKDILNFNAFLDAGTINQEEYDFLEFIDSRKELMKRLFEII